jgi:hypothetical protein
MSRFNISAEPETRGVKPETKRGDFNKDGAPGRKSGVQVGAKRNLYKNDGTLRRNLVQTREMKQ